MNCGVGTRHRGAGRPDVRQRSGLRPELRCRVYDFGCRPDQGS